jgi:hypothetical protein
MLTRRIAKWSCRHDVAPPLACARHDIEPPLACAYRLHVRIGEARRLHVHVAVALLLHTAQVRGRRRAVAAFEAPLLKGGARVQVQ